MRAKLLAIARHSTPLKRWLQLVHEEGEQHPINRWLTRFEPRLTALAALSAVIVLLQSRGVTSLLAWTDRLFPASRYPWLFGGFVVLYAVLHYAGEQRRKPLLLAGSLAALLYFDARFAAVSLGFFASYYGVVFAPISRWLKLGFLVVAFGALVAVADVLWNPRVLTEQPWLAALAYAFAVSYTFRIFYFFHEAKMRKFKRVPFDDFLLYFLFAPYFVIVPYMFSIPRFGAFARGLAKRDEAREVSGVRYLLAGVVFMLLYWAVAEAYSPRDELMRLLRAEQWASAVGVGLLYYPVEAVLSILGIAYTLTGMLRVLGADVHPPFKRPLGATSIQEWWRRWNIHFRDFLVDIFFYPLMIKWRKRNPYITIVVGCASVFLVGSTIFHWLGKYFFQVGSHANTYWSISVENTLMCVAVATGLCLEKRRLLNSSGRPAGPPPRLADTSRPMSRWWRYQVGQGAKLVATYAFLLSVVVFAGYGATYAAYYEPVEETSAPFARAIAQVDAGDPDAAADIVRPFVAQLTDQVRKVPREPLRRLRLAFAHSLPAAWADRALSRRHLIVALRFVDPTDPAQLELIRHLSPTAKNRVVESTRSRGSAHPPNTLLDPSPAQL